MMKMLKLLKRRIEKNMSASPKLRFIRFKPEHFETYQSWFENDRIKSTLYGIDNEWLEFVLNNETGIEYAVFVVNEMVAVVGIELPTSTDPFYAITNIAVNPDLFRSGIGTLILKGLYEKHELKVGEKWIVYVEEKNYSAQSFFSKNGWKRKKSNDGMIRFEMNNILINLKV